jgi:hypothetical protein
MLRGIKEILRIIKAMMRRIKEILVGVKGMLRGIKGTYRMRSNKKSKINDRICLMFNKAYIFFNFVLLAVTVCCLKKSFYEWFKKRMLSENKKN